VQEMRKELGEMRDQLKRVTDDQRAPLK